MVKNSYELRLMRESGHIAASALKKALNAIKVGITPLDLNEIASREIHRLGGDWSYKTVPGYKHATCITINEQVVHGIPTNVKIKEADLVSVDLAVVFKGWHTDCAWSVLVSGQGAGDPLTTSTSFSTGSLGTSSEKKEKKKFLEAGEKALWDGISQAIVGNRMGDISHAIQSGIEKAGYHVVRSLVGHGIGKKLHEEPEVLGYGKKGVGVVLRRGMTLAIEVIYTKGTSEVILGKDGWTYSSADGSLAGLFEMTVAVGKEKGQVLTDWRN